MITYRILFNPAELEEVVDLEIAIWGVHPRDAVPSALLHIMALNGGLVLGAYDGARMVGMLASLAVKRGGEALLWSHMTGTLPAYQRRGIGLELKRYQRRWALENGYQTIGWTFDPLQRGNAWFNLHLLGENAALTGSVYHVNFYGDMDDDINRGMPSDRIEVCWSLDQPSRQRPIPAAVPLLLASDADDLPAARETTWDSSHYAVTVPTDLAALRIANPDAVLAWRLAVREALLGAFERGYAATDFVKQNDSYIYVLSKQAAPA